MFTGIIETLGIIKHIKPKGSNLSFAVETTICNELKVDQSIAHNGICLTVEKIENGMHWVTAIQETINKTTIANWEINNQINIERCLPTHGRIDGHFVQGHVDTIATCIEKKDANGSIVFNFEFDNRFAKLVIEKGSICINGISLTCFNVTNTTFSVAIIPYTYNNTNMHNVEVNTLVNVEFDVLGKYINRFNELKN